MSTYGWNLETWSRVHQTVLDYLDESGEDEPAIKLYTAGNTLLATIELSFGDSEIDSHVDENGNLVLLPISETFTPVSSGEAAYCTVCNRSGTVIRKLVCVERSLPVTDACALSDLTLTELVPVDIISLVFAAGDTLE